MKTNQWAGYLRQFTSQIFTYSILISCAVILCEAYYFVTDKEYEEELKAGNIIPDVVDRIPEDVLQVEYYNGEEPNLGHTLSSHIVYIPPVSLRWRLVEKGALYTVILIDLDVPTTENPSDRSHVHWMLTNILNEKFRKADTVATYEPILVPEEDKGKHRLVFLCYKQRNQINVTEKFDDNEGKPNKKARAKFSHLKFAEKYKLDHPFALNWYYVRHCPNFTYTTIDPKALDI